jgi:SAM-dependent methyltransferase
MTTSDRDSLGSHRQFGYEWSNYPEIVPEHEEQFLRWISAIDLNELRNKKVVDAGCGNGRNSFWLAKQGVKSILAFDVEPLTVEVAKKNLSHLSNCSVVQSSIYDSEGLPDYSESYEIVFSIGVIHHLSEPSAALSSLQKLVVPGGKLVIWVYGKEGNEFLLKILVPVRVFTTRLPIRYVDLFSKFLASLLFIALRVRTPKSKYFQLARNWNFRHLSSVIFDQLFPKIANYWTKDEVLEVATLGGWHPLRITQINGMSWSLLAEKR